MKAVAKNGVSSVHLTTEAIDYEELLAFRPKITKWPQCCLEERRTAMNDGGTGNDGGRPRGPSPCNDVRVGFLSKRYSLDLYTRLSTEMMRGDLDQVPLKDTTNARTFPSLTLKCKSTWPHSAKPRTHGLSIA